MKKYIIACVLIGCLAVEFLRADRTFGSSYYGFRARGMGNTSIAVMDDWNALMSNPAGLNSFSRKLGFYLGSGIGGGNGLAEFAKFAFENAKKLTNPNAITINFLKELSKDHDNVWRTVSFSPDAIVITKDFGLGVYSMNETFFSLESGAYYPKLGISGFYDWVLAGGISNRYRDWLSIGMSGKYFVQSQVEYSYLDIPESVRRGDLLTQGDYYGGFRGLGLFSMGMSFDVGTIIHLGYKKSTKLAWVVQDILGYKGHDRLLIQHHIGIAQHIPPMIDGMIVKDALISVEIKDIARKSEVKRFGKKLHAGVEIRLAYLDLRTGINQGYPTGGVGLHFPIVHIDYLYFNEEMGTYVGQRPNPTHSFKIGFGVF